MRNHSSKACPSPALTFRPTKADHHAHLRHKWTVLHPSAIELTKYHGFEPRAAIYPAVAIAQTASRQTPTTASIAKYESSARELYACSHSRTYSQSPNHGC